MGIKCLYFDTHHNKKMAGRAYTSSGFTNQQSRRIVNISDVECVLLLTLSKQFGKTEYVRKYSRGRLYT